MSVNVQTQLLGMQIELKSRDADGPYWTDTRDTSSGPLTGIVRTVACGDDGVIVLHIEDEAGWIHTRSTSSNLFRVRVVPKGDAVTDEAIRRASSFVRVKDLKPGHVFKFMPPLPGWSTEKLIVVEQAPGWAMAEGYDFFLWADTQRASIMNAAVDLLDEKAPMPGGPSIPEDEP